ncbi:MAG: hypothetical protein HYT87_08145 [Nitrospirae bacterium]|nr:hypothetical protein [Nitrospirota bacterium]
MRILQSPGAAPEVRRVRIHLFCVLAAMLLLGLGPYLPSPIQPVHLCLATVVFLALSRPSWSDLVAVFLYGIWMDSLYSWFKGYALSWVVVYLLIQGLLRIVRVNSVATRTAVGAGTFTAVWAVRWLLSETFDSEGAYFRWGWLLLQPLLGAGWTLLCFVLYERLERVGKEKSLVFRAR